ncbi:CRISPR-associated protein, Csx7 family [Candidatus Methanoperedens nitroreducens]|uniref:CRISPR-associated protein, Csx7 family n=1 Tax=Candidatus Methanoperedens nitratireducens TaxID=1392998 RepID=A0A062V2S3_9EURY|nr:CRISPR-associated RAMP protein Csx7 [Candidatus Methanoperedens nitroreducens]KCZ73381.1 CRISPR-associated protein, Csx7 family [Candidatus Methanoperedens nitroreducens]MDJ1422668.1 CRISPR-associated RAMP protein Csx7 [Candidatus Methanoperedens sp.]
MFEKLESRALIQYTIKTKSDLHIGGHGTTAPAEVDSPVLKNDRDLPIIPGSSLKGVLRTEMERLLKGLNIDTCAVPDVCKSKKRKVGSECPVCMLFGGAELAGSVRIKDATANSKKTVIRDGVAIERKTRKAKGGAKYDIEAVPYGTEFYGEAVIENPDISGNKNAKLGAFLSLIEFFNYCSGGIGHATSRGFGQVSIEIDNFRLITAGDYLAGNYEGKIYPCSEPEFEKVKEQAITSWSAYLGSIKGNV